MLETSSTVEGLQFLHHSVQFFCALDCEFQFVTTGGTTEGLTQHRHLPTT